MALSTKNQIKSSNYFDYYNVFSVIQSLVYYVFVHVIYEILTLCAIANKIQNGVLID